MQGNPTEKVVNLSQPVMGIVFENDEKNDVLSFPFRFFKTKNETTSFSLVINEKV